ncbi:MAG: QueT transporter family protein [Oscillospiraceae bacterium]|nr:QueT transporter family protein [Oscillospiraceae bacterium]
MPSQRKTWVYKLALSGLVMAVYVVIMWLTQSFAFREYQIRLATSLYALGAPFPFLIVPLGLANLLSNLLLGGLGPLDAAGGFAAGVLTAAAAYGLRRLGRNDMWIALPVIFIPGLLVPVWLSRLLGLPYTVLAVSLCAGQIIPGILGVILVKRLRKIV